MDYKTFVVYCNWFVKKWQMQVKYILKCFSCLSVWLARDGEGSCLQDINQMWCGALSQSSLQHVMLPWQFILASQVCRKWEHLTSIFYMEEFEEH